MKVALIEKQANRIKSLARPTESQVMSKWLSSLHGKSGADPSHVPAHWSAFASMKTGDGRSVSQSVSCWHWTVLIRSSLLVSSVPWSRRSRRLRHQVFSRSASRQENRHKNVNRHFILDTRRLVLAGIQQELPLVKNERRKVQGSKREILTFPGWPQAS